VVPTAGAPQRFAGREKPVAASRRLSGDRRLTQVKVLQSYPVASVAPSFPLHNCDLGAGRQKGRATY